MDIQKVNLGAPVTGEGGDLYREAHEKINDNFDVLQDVTERDAITINEDKIYPFARRTRGGVNIESSIYWTAAIIDAYVINAKPDHYYQISYYANGDPRVADPEGWSIERAAIADYESTGVMQRILRYTVPQRQLKTNSIDTIRLKTEGDETVVITVDTSRLPTRNIPLKAISSDQDGYADIISPSTYLYTESTSKLTSDLATLNTKVDNLPVSSGPMTATLASGTLSVIYPSSNRQYRLNFAPNGFNNLPNIVGFDYKTTGNWIAINSGTTDWLPPLAAVASSGDGASLIYTGGNHGSSGSAGGSQTARNIYYDIKIDGKSVTAYSGNCGRIEITIINELMASNTITLNRYAIREAFKVVIVNGVITVDCQRTALEPLVMRTDNGLQAVSTGVADSYLLLNGKTNTRQAWGEFDSGNKSVQPKAWAAVIQGNSNQLASWMDRSYGAGDGRYVADTAPFIRRGTGTNTKIYHAVVASVSPSLTTGESYKWRGGYHMKATAEKPSGADSQFDATQRIIAYSANDYMTV